ncbi:MAG: T9SS type A sorting domain-containing protein [Bacteroidetes bacterium]|nr:T9SS type A sorting domain-containing protein [Bacteroidota bacterium]
MKYILISIYAITLYRSQAQNLVINPSFEDTLDCQTWWNSGNLPSLQSVSWYQSIGSPDFWSTTYTPGCGTAPFPNNFTGYQTARSGDNCTGFAASGFPNYINLKECITGKLTSPLIQGHKYFAKMYLNSCDSCYLHIDKIGMFFSNDSVNPDTSNLFYMNPQIENSAGVILSDTIGWMEVSGYFNSVGGESFITIGCFRPDSLLQFDSIIQWPIIAAYYFLDDISVIDCTAISLPDIADTKLNVWYDATNNKLVISTNEQIENYTLLDMLGKTTLQGKLLNNEISAAALSRGVYMLVVEDKRYRRRVFKVGVY